MSVKDNQIFCFDIENNVYIEVIDKNLHKIKKQVKTHNKATRKMVTGILRFLMGNFTASNKNEIAAYDTAKDYIPCYVGFGTGGVIEIPTEPGNIPRLDPNWSRVVDYDSTAMVSEIENTRTLIRVQTTTFDNDQPNSGDMDGIFFLCELSPNYLTSSTNKPITITEIGLFADSIPNQDDLLAYIKLGNYEDGNEIKTDTLYVQPKDTVIVRWVITIAAIGKDNRLKLNITDESGDVLEDTTIVPELDPVKIEVIPDD